MIRTRIAVDARLPWGSGIGRNVANCVPRIARILTDYDFVLHVTQSEVATAVSTIDGLANVTVKPLDIAPFSFAEQVRIPGAYADFDLTWFTNYWVPLFFTHPFVATVYDLLHLEAGLFPANPIKRTLSRLTFRKIASDARALTFISRFSEQEFSKRFGRRVPMSIAGIGIDHDGWQPFNPDAPPEKKTQILIVAAAKKHKNSQIAIDAFLRANVADHWRMIIVAPGDMLRTSIDLAARSRNDRIDFVERLSNDALRQLYADSAIVLMPSLYEGFGLPLVEGLQAGAQCISSTADALIEVGEGALVTYVDPHDLAGWTAAIEADCHQFDRNGIDPVAQKTNMRHAMTFRWDDVAQSVAAMIDNAVKGVGPA